MPQRSTIATSLIVGLVILALVVLQFGLWTALLNPGEYERADVTIVDESGERLGTVDVRIANTSDQRVLGLSRTDSLAPNEGMLFVHDREDRHRYVMRGMAVPLDIVFVDANGTITAIHHASTPPPLTPEIMLERYAGHGKYVLEVERGWTNGTGVAVGDRVVIPDDVGTTDDGQASGTPTAPDGAETATDTPERPTVTAVDDSGTTLGTVSVAIADNGSERYTGLSETADLGADEGMLFVHERAGRQTYVMRNMSFPLDMIFVAPNGTVTAIHHADVPPPERDDLRGYSGYGLYVLEVNQGWANETGLDVGDRIRVPAGY